MKLLQILKLPRGRFYVQKEEDECFKNPLLLEKGDGELLNDVMSHVLLQMKQPRAAFQVSDLLKLSLTHSLSCEHKAKLELASH